MPKKSTKPNRAFQVADQIQRDLAELIREVKDPRLGMVTINSVEVTLDPLATGVLPLCLGAATKFGQLQLDADKTYEAALRLGVKTSTGDAEGAVISTRPVPPIDESMLGEVARRFSGPIRQVPPMHS